MNSTFLGTAIASFFVMALVSGANAAAAEAIELKVTDKGCEPASISVPAGKSVFSINNRSARTMEWEVLDGVMVVAERENIIPGFVTPVSAKLTAGKYVMTCGLKSNPKGELLVLASTTAATGPVNPNDLVAPLAEYKVFVLKEVEAFAAETKKFTDAVKAGNLEEAQKLYAPARHHYELIEPIAELFSDLDGKIDVRPDDFEKKEDDPQFTGYHRLEKALFADKSTKGMEALADGLNNNVTELLKRIGELAVPPGVMVGGAASLIEEVAAHKITGEEDRYSGTDLWDFNANVTGSKKIFSLMKPLLADRNPDIVGRIDKNFTTVETTLAKYQKEDGGFENYSKLTPEDRTAMKGPITILAEDLSQLRGVLGLD